MSAEGGGHEDAEPPDDIDSSEVADAARDANPKPLELAWQPGLESYLRNVIGPIVRQVDHINRIAEVARAAIPRIEPPKVDVLGFDMPKVDLPDIRIAPDLGRNPLNAVDPLGLCGEPAGFIGPTIPCPRYDFEFETKTLNSGQRGLGIGFEWLCVGDPFGETQSREENFFFWVGVVTTTFEWRLQDQQINWHDAKTGVLYSAQRTVTWGTRTDELTAGDFRTSFNPFTSIDISGTVPYIEQRSPVTVRGLYVGTGDQFLPKYGLSLF